MARFNSDSARKLARRRLSATNLMLVRADIRRLNGLEGLPTKELEVLHGWGNLAERLQLPTELRQDLATLKCAVKWVVCVSKRYLAREKLMKEVGLAEVQQLIDIRVRYHRRNATIIGFHYDGQLRVRYLDEVEGEEQVVRARPDLLIPQGASV